MLSLVTYLRERPGARVEDVARAFGITEDELVSDLDVLPMCGTSFRGGDLLDIDTDGEHIWWHNPAALAAEAAEPLRLAADEATALLVAARAVATLPGLRESDRQALLRATAKVETAAGEAAGASSRLRRPWGRPRRAAARSRAARRGRVRWRGRCARSRPSPTRRPCGPRRRRRGASAGPAWGRSACVGPACSCCVALPVRACCARHGTPNQRLSAEQDHLDLGAGLDGLGVLGDDDQRVRVGEGRDQVRSGTADRGDAAVRVGAAQELAAALG